MAIGIWGDIWGDIWDNAIWGEVAVTVPDSTHATTLYDALNDAVLSVFGNTTSIVLTDNSSLSITAIFDHDFIETSGIEGYRPVLHCATDDISSVTRGSYTRINSVLYTVAGIEPDGGGMTKLILERLNES